ncbi:MAG: glycosyl transferase [bacterium]|nr:glycosyl transferase [bacterium]
MIPKIIHYGWFGGGPLPVSVQKCIESWQRAMPDYKIMCWNESNFDISMYPYAQEALEAKKYAFVSDVVRLYALYTVGGVYMDTDVETLKSFDPFLQHEFVSGFETETYVHTGMMAARAGHPWVKELLDQYITRRFTIDGRYNQLTNTQVITAYMVTKGLVRNNEYQVLSSVGDGGTISATFYPSKFFCPKDYTTGVIHLTPETVCIHHFAGTWINRSFISVVRHGVKLWLVKIFGERVIKRLRR